MKTHRYSIPKTVVSSISHCASLRRQRRPSSTATARSCGINRIGTRRASNRYLITHGTFGPALAEVRHAVVTPGQMKWVRLESGPGLRLAVFEFDVSMAESGFRRRLLLARWREEIIRFASKRGIALKFLEILSDGGPLLRLREQFDMNGYIPMDRDEILIDYGPVKIGGKTYSVARSVSLLLRGRSITSRKYGIKVPDLRPLFHQERTICAFKLPSVPSEIRIPPGFKAEN